MKIPSLKNDEIVFSGRIIPSVIDVEYLGEYKLYLEFDDGKSGELDLGDFIDSVPPLHVLKDLNRFKQFSLSDGTLRWAQNMDISPRWLHDHIK